MFKNQAFTFLNKYIGDYLYGFNADQLKVGVLNGSVKLKNLTFQPEKVNQYLIFIHSPLLLKAGIIGNMSLELNYFDISKTEIIIEDLLIVIGPNIHEVREEKEYQTNDERFVHISKKIPEYEKFKGDILKQKGFHPHFNLNYFLNKEQKSSQFSKTSQVPFGNLKDIDRAEKKNETEIFKSILGLDYTKFKKVLINNIHFRYEDDQFTYKHPISIGILIKNIMITPNPSINVSMPVTTQSKLYAYYDQEKKIVDTFFNDTIKKQGIKTYSLQILINNFEVYVNPQSEMYIPFSLYISTLKSPHGIFEAMPPLELKALMVEYFDASKYHVKEPLIKIDRIEIQNLIATLSIPNSPNYKNFLVMNFNIYNLSVSVQPVILEDLFEFFEYFDNFKIWSGMEELRPTVRPMTNQKILTASDSTLKLNKIIVREWFQTVLWHNRLKRIVKARRFDLLPLLENEYKRKSLINAIETFMPKQRNLQGRIPMSHEFFNDMFYQGELIDIEPKKSFLTRKNMMIIAFVSLKNTSLYLQHNGNSPFLQAKIDDIHLNNFQNVDFNSSISATLHMKTLRIMKPTKNQKLNESAMKFNPNVNNEISPRIVNMPTQKQQQQQAPAQESKLMSIFNGFFNKSEQIPHQNANRVSTTTAITNTATKNPPRSPNPMTIQIPGRNGSHVDAKVQTVDRTSNTPLTAGAYPLLPASNRVIGEDLMTIKHSNNNNNMNTIKSLSPLKIGNPYAEILSQQNGLSKIKGSPGVNRISTTSQNRQITNNNVISSNKNGISIFGSSSLQLQNQNGVDAKNGGYLKTDPNVPQMNRNIQIQDNSALSQMQPIRESVSLASTSKKPFFGDNSMSLHQDADGGRGGPDSSINSGIINNSLMKNTHHNGIEGPYIELKDDLLMKIIFQPLKANNSKSYQIQTEIFDIDICLENQIIIEISNLLNEFKQAYYFRFFTLKSMVQNKIKFIKSKAQQGFYTLHNKVDKSLLSNPLTKPKPIINIFNNNSKLDKNGQNLQNNNKVLENNTHNDNPAANENKFQNQKLDMTSYFLKKITDFISINEVLVHIKTGNISLIMSDTSAGVDQGSSSLSKYDLFRICIPKEAIRIALNIENSSFNTISIFGITFETTNKFQAIYFLYKRLFETIKRSIDDQLEMNRMFYEFSADNNAKNSVEVREFLNQYSNMNAKSTPLFQAKTN